MDKITRSKPGEREEEILRILDHEDEAMYEGMTIKQIERKLPYHLRMAAMSSTRKALGKLIEKKKVEKFKLTEHSILRYKLR